MKPGTTITRPKRFYTVVEVASLDEGYGILLDGKPLRTPARRSFVVPARHAADIVAAEWDAQKVTIEPSTMPATRIVHSAIDGVADQMEAVRAEVVKYAASDLICYRAAEPEALVVAEAKAWDPLLDWCHASLGARFILAQGLTFVSQPETALDAINAAVQEFASPIDLAALHVMTTLTGSAIIALAVARHVADPDTGWAAAHVDETFQEERWGRDDEATARRAARKRDFMAAARLLGA